MNLARERSLIEGALDGYRKWLDTIPNEQFNTIPPIGGWSYAQVYSHLLKANLDCGIAIDKCIHKTCPPTKKGLNMIGLFMLAFASFPPFKVKAPESVATGSPSTELNKEEARNLIIKSRKQLDKLYPLIAGALPGYRMQHPRMGMLNAAQWFKFIRIHSLHHLKQLERIKNSFEKK